MEVDKSMKEKIKSGVKLTFGLIIGFIVFKGKGL